MDDDPERLLALLQQDPATARQLVQAQLAERAASDPMMAMVLQMATSARASDTDEADQDHDERSQAGELRGELARAQDLLDDLAAALGACAACWGADEGCRACRGHGVPGWRIPDEAMFDAIVAPALRRRSRNHHAQGRNA